MSSSIHTHKTNKMKRPALRAAALHIGTVFTLFLIILLLAIALREKKPWSDYQKPDDIQVARQLLAEKFSGPRYFQFEKETPFYPPYYISNIDARRQAEEIASKRQLSSEQLAKLSNLITALSESVSMRIGGIYRVNTLQLNLALDEIK